MDGKKALALRLRYHPFRIFTILILMGITSAFLTLSVSYFLTTYGTAFNRFQIPAIFHANSIIILVSSYSMHQTRLANERDDMKGYMNGLLVTSGLGIAFTVFQVYGWQELFRSGIAMTNNVAGAYLYVISGLHLAHLVVGVGILLWFLYKAYEHQEDQVKNLLFDTDPVEKMKVRMLGVYWHFVDILWIYLYLFFLLNIYVFAYSKATPIGL